MSGTTSQDAMFNLSDYLSAFRGRDGRGHPEGERGYRSDFPIAKRITCADGFSLSVQAHSAAYCAPRINRGPWWEVEVGFPSRAPELIMNHAETPDDPTGTVYGYVPSELVEELILLHGGPNEETLAAMRDALAKATA